MNFQEEFSQLVGYKSIEVASLSDINLVLKIAQDNKSIVCETLRMEMADLTKRSTLIVRLKMNERRITNQRTLDFVEMPASNILSKPITPAYMSGK